jgi:hypothetical protein
VLEVGVGLRVPVVIMEAAAELADMREQVDSEMPVASVNRVALAVAAREEVEGVALAGLQREDVRGRVEELGCWVKGFLAMQGFTYVALKLPRQGAAEVQMLIIPLVRPECMVVVV